MTVGLYSCLSYWRTKLMLLIILSSLAGPAVPYFPTLSNKQRDFQNTLLKIKSVLIFSTAFV